MTLTFGAILGSADIDPAEAMVIRHAYVRGDVYAIHADSTAEQVLAYTSEQSADPRIFPANPPKNWIVFLPEAGDRARLWGVVTNNGELTTAAGGRMFDLEQTEHMADLRNRLVIGWRSPRKWWIKATTAAAYSVAEIADAEPVPFPGFDALLLNYPQLQAVMRDHRYASWRTALSSVQGVYLITDTRDGRHYVGKADGAENIRQRWAAYAANGHGNNTELRNRTPDAFQYSLLRVFDPATPETVINAAEVHFKRALDSVNHGMNRGY